MKDEELRLRLNNINKISKVEAKIYNLFTFYMLEWRKRKGNRWGFAIFLTFTWRDLALYRL